MTFDPKQALALVERFRAAINRPARPNVISAHVDDMEAMCAHITAALAEIERLEAENDAYRDMAARINKPGILKRRLEERAAKRKGADQ